MQFIGRALLASVFVLGACAGGDKNAAKSDSSSAMSSTTTTSTTTTPATGQLGDGVVFVRRGCRTCGGEHAPAGGAAAAAPAPARRSK